MVAALVFFVMIPVLHMYAANLNFAMPPSSWKLLSYFSDFFLGAFAIIYLIASITICGRFYVKRRLCRMDNCTFYIFTVGIFILSLLGLDYIHEASIRHTEDFASSCA